MITGNVAARVMSIVVLTSPGGPGEPAEIRHHLIDMVVAQVDATVITLSELVAETRLVLLRTGGPEVARAGFLSQDLLNAVLRSIVARELLLGEVRRLKLPEVPDAEIVRALETVRGRFAASADYERFLDKSGFREPGAEGIRAFEAPPSLVAIVAAELQVDRFLELRVRRNVVVKESDIVLCYESNRSRFMGQEPKDVRSVIRARLETERRERGLEALLEQLEKRATVRYVAPFEPARSSPSEEALTFSCPEPPRGRAEAGEGR